MRLWSPIKRKYRQYLVLADELNIVQLGCTFVDHRILHAARAQEAESRGDTGQLPLGSPARIVAPYLQRFLFLVT